MVKNNNVWIIYVVALIAIAALILGAIALNKANMTGNAFWDKWFAQEKGGDPDATVEVGASSESCQEPDFGRCIRDCDEKTTTGTDFDECLRKCFDDWCTPLPDGPAGVGRGYGLLGDSFINGGGSKSELASYMVEFDENGNMMYEILEEKSLLSPGEGYQINQVAGKNNRVQIDPIGGSDAPGPGPKVECWCSASQTGSCTITITGSKADCDGNCGCDWTLVEESLEDLMGDL